MKSGAHSGHAPPAWWDELPDDFHRQRDGTEIDAEHRLEMRAVAGLDRIVRTALSAALLPSMLTRRGIAQQLQAMRSHARLARQADSALTFAPPPQGVPVQELRPRRTASRMQGIPYQLLRFESPFQVSDAQAAQGYGRLARNATAYAQHWYHAGGARPTLILIHGFMLDSYRVNAWLFSLRWFYRQGYDILLYTLPFHGERVEDRDWFSGYRLFAHGLVHFNEAMVHAIHDLRVFIDYLEQRGATKIGVSGFSLGGYTAALLAGVDARLAFYIPKCPPVSPMDLLREWQPCGTLLAGLLRWNGVTMPQLRAAFAVHNPLTYAPKVPAERLLIVGRGGDRMAPPKHLHLLHKHWPGSRLHWLRGSHLLNLRRAEYLQVMKEFMDARTGGPHASGASRVVQPANSNPTRAVP